MDLDGKNDNFDFSDSSYINHVDIFFKRINHPTFSNVRTNQAPKFLLYTGWGNKIFIPSSPLLHIYYLGSGGGENFIAPPCSWGALLVSCIFGNFKA